jgi:hypothetical protein
LVANTSRRSMREAKPFVQNAHLDILIKKRLLVRFRFPRLMDRASRGGLTLCGTKFRWQPSLAPRPERISSPRSKRRLNCDVKENHPMSRSRIRADDGLQSRAITTIRPLLPPNARERVKRTITEYNRIVRGHVRDETGLNLVDERGHGSAPVFVEDGFPCGVAQLIDNHRDPVLWRLIALRPALDQAASGLAELLEQWCDIADWPQLPVVRNGIDSLEYSAYLVGGLQEISAVDTVFRELAEIREDILGAYRFFPGTPRIEIYWMAQALFAAAFGVAIEELTVVTLAHELAHAYTHLGRDIDGTTWRNPGFAVSDPNIVEGLAQHITGAVMERLGTRIPGAYGAFHELLKHQSGPYRAHETWFPNATARRSEIVRFAMLRARYRGKVADLEWLQMLSDARHNLTRP